MAITNSYDINLQSEMASSPKNNKLFGRFDPIHIGLAVISIIFIILSIVFIILFATKHDTSSSFLTTGFTMNSKSELENDFKSRLQQKYTLNSFGLDVQNNQVNAVYSLRGSVSVDEAKNALSGSKMVTQMETTYGDNAYSVCHQTQTISTSQQPATNTPTTPSTPKPPSQYCNGSPQRDILLVIDMNDLQKTNKTLKISSLDTIKNKIASNVNFASTQIFIGATAGNQIVDISTSFADTKDKFLNDFNNVYNVQNTTIRQSLDFGTLKTYAFNKFPARSSTPDEVILLTDKPVSSQSVDKSNTGIYFTIAGVNKNYVKQYSTYIDESLSYDSWTDLANNDPFSQLVCSFFKKPVTTASQRYLLDYLNADDTTNSPKCEVLDMILLFDTSESLSRILLEDYKNFATKFVKQYKTSDDLTRIGVMFFNSETSEILKLVQGTNLDNVLQAIQSVQYTAGLTDITKALNAAFAAFQVESRAASGKVLVVLSDAIPTVDTYANEIIAGKQLSDFGVQTLIVGYEAFSADVLQQLDQITKPEYIYQSLDDTTLNGVTANILANYPCPAPQCVTAYYAVEVSEATNDVVVDNLKSVIQLVDASSALQTGTELYQLITYSEGLTKFTPANAVDAKGFKTYLQTLIDDSTKLDALRGGNTRLDTSMNDITAQLALISKKNNRFSADLLFFGEANDAVLDPDVTTDEKRNQLKTAALNLQSQTGGRIYVVDVSRPVNLYGTVLWDSVTPSDHIVNSTQYLSTTNYFTEWSSLSCQLPAYSYCYDTQVDIAIILDLQKQDYDFINYIQNFVEKFSAQDDAHISMFAYGAQKTMLLTDLAVHSYADLQNSIVTYEEWRNGSLFITTTTTPAPTSSTVKPKLFEDLYTVQTTTVTQLFDAIRTQFGCSHYSDDTDRVFAPNVFIIASDNLASYTDAVWNQFQTELHSRFGCWDCAGTPTFLFLSRTDAKAPTSLGSTINIATSDLDIDRDDDTSTQANINKFNGIVNSVCSTSMRACSSYFSCTSA
ncbi:unnamed protein product [Caenorhabditis angaria]|uniref:VWFA domain-containing protein n=1 Tax=Caenorhabditis angaria TaxID=860376 RepID=A0A9P1I9H9_9PELO|nr:unnamed protein product [Caenorhabditis angaria]